MIDHVGQQLGNYRLIRSLGSGGFADVYLGEHIYLNTQAAIKILQTRLAQNDLQVFLAEARTIVNLTHRNIVQVLEFGVEKDTPFLVMTYAPNGNLRHRHPSGSRLSTSEVASYIKQVADALQYAHERRVIHRDVKPDNMLVGQNGDILLSDFGIAVVAQSSRYSGQEVGGTAAYMAPEQLQGQASPASDQYALAVTAYEWLTGDRPFNGSFAEVCSQHLLAPPPPLRQKVPSLPPAVEQVILAALNKHPQQRFPNIQAFAQALAQASGVYQGLGTAAAYTSATQSEEQIATILKQPTNSQHANSTYFSPSNNQLGSYPAYNTQPPQQAYNTQQPPQTYTTPSSQAWNPSAPPPPPNVSMPPNNGNLTPPFTQFAMPPNNSNLTPPFAQSAMPPNNGNLTPSFNQSAMAPGQFSPQGPTIPSGPEKKPGGNKGKMFAIIALVVILLAVTSAGAVYFLANKKTSSTASGGQTVSTATTLTGSSTTPTSDSTTPTTVSTTPTSDSTTPTTVSTDTPVAQPSTTVADGVITKNLLLTCGGCNDPVHVTINTIQIDNGNGRMIWDTTLKDVTGTGHGYGITQYNLQANGSQTSVAAVLSQSSMDGNSKQYDIQATFAFVPYHNVAYTLTVVVVWGGSYTTFDPVKITF